MPVHREARLAPWHAVGSIHRMTLSHRVHIGILEGPNFGVPNHRIVFGLHHYAAFHI